MNPENNRPNTFHLKDYPSIFNRLPTHSASMVYETSYDSNFDVESTKSQSPPLSTPIFYLPAHENPKRQYYDPQYQRYYFREPVHQRYQHPSEFYQNNRYRNEQFYAPRILINARVNPYNPVTPRPRPHFCQNPCLISTPYQNNYIYEPPNPPHISHNSTYRDNITIQPHCSQPPPTIIISKNYSYHTKMHHSPANQPRPPNSNSNINLVPVLQKILNHPQKSINTPILFVSPNHNDQSIIEIKESVDHPIVEKTSQPSLERQPQKPEIEKPLNPPASCSEKLIPPVSSSQKSNPPLPNLKPFTKLSNLNFDHVYCICGLVLRVHQYYDSESKLFVQCLTITDESLGSNNAIHCYLTSPSLDSFPFVTFYSIIIMDQIILKKSPENRKICYKSPNSKYFLFKIEEDEFFKLKPSDENMLNSKHIDWIIELYIWASCIQLNEITISKLYESTITNDINACVLVLAIALFETQGFCFLFVTDGSPRIHPYKALISGASHFQASFLNLIRFKDKICLVLISKEYLSLVSNIKPFDYLRLTLRIDKTLQFYRLACNGPISPLTILNDDCPDIQNILKQSIQNDPKRQKGKIIFGNIKILNTNTVNYQQKNWKFYLRYSNILKQLKFYGKMFIKLSELTAKRRNYPKFCLVSAKISYIWPSSFSLGIIVFCKSCRNLPKPLFLHDDNGLAICLRCRTVILPVLRFVLVLTHKNISFPVLLRNKNALEFFELPRNLDRLTSSLCKNIDSKYYRFFYEFSSNEKVIRESFPKIDMPLFARIHSNELEKKGIIYELFGVILSFL